MLFAAFQREYSAFLVEGPAEIAVKTVKEWLSENEGQIDRVIFNVFKDEDREIYEAIAQLEFNSAVYAMQILQAQMADEAEKTGLNSDDAVMEMVKEIRSESVE